MISKQKGDIAEAATMLELLKYGILTSRPFGDSARYDLIADFNGSLNRIQIKYCDCTTDNESVICPCISSYNHTTNKKKKKYTEDVDYFAFYFPLFGKVAFVPINIIGDKSTITFRNSSTTKNNQSKNIHLIDDYSISKILQ